MNDEGFDAVIERLRETDPDVVLAADEVDQTLLDWFATLPLAARLDRAGRMASVLESLGHARRTS